MTVLIQTEYTVLVDVTAEILQRIFTPDTPTAYELVVNKDGARTDSVRWRRILVGIARNEITHWGYAVIGANDRAGGSEVHVYERKGGGFECLASAFLPNYRA